MRTQEEIRAEIDMLLEQDRLEEADKLIDQLVPISAEEFRRRLDEAPYDDEPVTPEQQASIDRTRAMLAAMRTPSGAGRRAG
jgi:hypothetical protein